MQPRRRTRPQFAIPVLALLVIVVAGACGSTTDNSVPPTPSVTPATAAPATSAPTTTAPPPHYPGTLRMMTTVTENGVSFQRVMELTSASFDPVPVTSYPDIRGTGKAFAPDGRHIVYEDFDHKTHVLGENTDTVLPEGVSGPISPDATRLAYWSTVNDDVSLFVYDLASGTSNVVLTTPCSYYAGAPGDGKVCGAIAGELWVDDATLFVSHFAGPTPEKISCAPTSSAAACSSFTPNTFSLVGTDGRVLGTAPYPKAVAVSPGYVRADTVVLNDGTWTDVSQMRSGTATTQSIPVQAEIDSLSPDGTTMVVPGTPNWELVDLRTGASVQLGTTAIASSASNYNINAAILWSADGQSFMASSAETQGELVWVPATSEPGSVVGKIGDAYPFAWLT